MERGNLASGVSKADTDDILNVSFMSWNDSFKLNSECVTASVSAASKEIKRKNQEVLEHM